MKKLLINIIMIIFAGSTVFSSTLNFNIPAEKGSPIKITYITDGIFFLGEDILARIYAYNATESIPTAYEFQLKFDGKNIYEGNFTLPNDKLYFLVTVTNLDITDNNRSKFWGSFTSLKNDKNAELLAGLTYLGNMPDNLNVKIDFKKALEHFKNETIKFPDNVQGQIAYTSLLLDLQKINFKEYSEKMENILKMSYDVNNENEVRAVSRALRTLNKNKEAEQLENNFVKLNPKSQLAEEKILSELSKLESLEKFSEAVVDYLKKFSVSSNRERLFSALVSGYLQTGNYQDIIAILNQFEDTPPSAYAQIAYSLVKDETFEKVDINIRIQKAIELMNTATYELKSDNFKFKPTYISITEWEKRNNIRLAGLFEQYGQILMSVEQFEDALAKYNQALDYYKKDAPNALYENVMELCGILKKPETAYEIGLLALNNNYPSQNIIDDMRVLHNELRKTEAFETWMIKMLNDTKMQRIKKLSYENLSDSINNIYLSDLSGKKINIKELTGKVLVITFWSSWCDPCDEALIGLDSLTKLYKDIPNIYFASVNLWESEEDIDKTVKEFFSEYKPQFNILVDNMSQSAYELGIGGLPFICFIGKDGKLEFVDKGYVNLEEFILSSKDKIDLLNN